MGSTEHHDSRDILTTWNHNLSLMPCIMTRNKKRATKQFDPTKLPQQIDRRSSSVSAIENEVARAEPIR